MSGDEESERLRLIAQLREEDPLWVLMEEISLDLRALFVAEPKGAEDEKLANELKQFLAFTAALQSAAENLHDAEGIASTVRKLILRRDVAGMEELARKH